MTDYETDHKKMRHSKKRKPALLIDVSRDLHTDSIISSAARRKQPFGLIDDWDGMLPVRDNSKISGLR
jgi:hypothetical protein